MPEHERPPQLTMVSVVKRHHGATFADEWFQNSWDTGAIQDAFGETHLMEWPSLAAPGVHETPEMACYSRIEDEILERTLEAVKASIIDAFVAAATDVLDRERRRQS